MTKNETIESVIQCFPEGLPADPTVARSIETIAGMKKNELALACAELLPSAYPSARKAERNHDVRELRRDFASLIATLFLGHKTEREATGTTARALVLGAKAWAREIEIQRIEAKAKALAAEIPKTGPTVRTLDGRTIAQSDAMAEIANNAQAMILDHARIYGRPARDHEKRTAVLVAKSELLGMTRAGAEAVARAQAKRARKAERLRAAFA